MRELAKCVADYVEQLRGSDSENAYHSLIEADDAVVPLLIKAFRATRDTSVRADLVDIIWQHRIPTTVDFLSEALDDPASQVWQAALDGLVSMGGESAVRALELARKQARSGDETEQERAEWIEEAIGQITERSAGQGIGD